MNRMYGRDVTLEQEGEEPVDERTEAKRRRVSTEKLLERLARELMGLSEKQLQKLNLPDPLLDACLDSLTIKSGAAINRQARIVRRALRESDWPVIRTHLDELSHHGVVSKNESEAELAESRWVARLITEGQSAIEEFLEEYEGADRRHLRDLVRAVLKQKGGPQRRSAEERLSRALGSAISLKGR